MGLKQFKREVRASVGKVLAYQIRDGFGASLSGLLEQIARGQPTSDAQLREHFQYALDDDASVDGGPKLVGFRAGPSYSPSSKAGKVIAVVPVTGVALYDVEYQPFCFSTRQLASTMNQLAADPTVDQIVLIFDTPGGQVTGTAEAGDAIYAARKKKTVTALVDPLCASAGYWLASQASRIIAVPSADIGSVGVFMMHADCSGALALNGIKPTFIFAKDSPYKVEGNSYEPLSPEALAYYQSEVDEIMDDFVAAIARGRGVKPDDVLKNYGQGRCLAADKALKAGMIDEISTMSMALQKMGIQSTVDIDVRRRRSEAAAEAQPQDDQAQADQSEALTEGLSIGGAAFIDGTITASNLSLEVDAAEVLRDGCEAINIRADQQDDRTTCYALNEWPSRCEISADLIVKNEGPLRVAGNQVTLTVENGHAVYAKLAETRDGSWICGLLAGSKYSPAPPTKEEADKALAEATRLRLAIHRAS